MFRLGLNRVLLIILTLLFLTTCLHQYVEYGYRFEVKGRVLDGRSQAPLSNVTVKLKTRNSGQWEDVLDVTEDDGLFSAQTDYRWGDKHLVLLPGKPTDPDLYLEFSKQGYVPKFLDLFYGSPPAHQINAINVGDVRVDPN